MEIGSRHECADTAHSQGLQANSVRSPALTALDLCAAVCVHAVGGGGDALDAEGFPFITTGKANYSPALVTLLNQQAAWQMLQLQPQLLQLLAQTNATVQPV